MFSAAGAVARWIAPSLTVAAVAGIAFLAGLLPVGSVPAVRLTDDANPFAGAPFYVNPGSAAMSAAQHADPPSPALTAIANTPQAYWVVPGSSAGTVAKYTGDATAAGAIPVLTIYGTRTATVAASPRVAWARPATTEGGSTASPPAWARHGRRSSSNPTHSPWPTACRPTSAKNATT